MSSKRPLVRRSDRDGVVTLTLDRPEQRNALNEAVIDELETHLAAIADAADVRVVVLAGAGPNFCAGHDLKEMRSKPDDEYYRQLFERCGRMMLSLLKLPQPVIASVRGVATAAGCQLVAFSDLAVATKAARFATSGINVGLFCSTPSVPLSRNVPRKRAFEMLVTGAFIDAATAQQIGLVNRVVPEAGLDAAVMDLASRIVEKAPAVVAAGKRMFYAQLEMNLEEALDYAARVMARDMLEPDASEGIDAFIEKRAPVWRGR
jgi:enoyl-CoA hydratase/carnithine racemase